MLVIACPHALGLAVPLVIAISTTLGARSGCSCATGVGSKRRAISTTVVFDKTGTLTRGEFRVVDIATDGSLDANEALRLAAAVERDSEHTIAQGIVKSAEERQTGRPEGRRSSKPFPVTAFGRSSRAESSTWAGRPCCGA